MTKQRRLITQHIVNIVNIYNCMNIAHMQMSIGSEIRAVWCPVTC